MPFSIADMPKSRLIIIGAVLLVVVLIIVIASIPKTPEGDPNLPAAANLTVWGLMEDRDAFIDLAKSYQALSEQTAKYRVEFVPFATSAELEQQLVNSLAEGSGPDIFYFHNSWTEKHKAKTQPAYSLLVNPSATAKLFPQTVSQDFMDQTEAGTYVYALPLHMDALGLIYNRDIVQASGVTFDAATWENLSWADFTHVVQTTKNIQGGQIARAGTALGTAKNVAWFSDIISSLLLQSGIQFAQADGRISFDKLAQNSFLFYLQFANRMSDNFTWDDSLGNSREEFAKGNVAAIVDYEAALRDIKKRNQFIDTSLVPLPQLSADASKKRTFASYWGLAVSKFSSQKYAAWHFARFATMSETANAAYLQNTAKRPALISLINKEIQANNDSAFLKSFFFARSWRQKDPAITKAVFGSLVDNMNAGRLSIDQATKSAQDTLNQ